MKVRLTGGILDKFFTNFSKIKSFLNFLMLVLIFSTNVSCKKELVSEVVNSKAETSSIVPVQKQTPQMACEMTKLDTFELVPGAKNRDINQLPTVTMTTNSKHLWVGGMGWTNENIGLTCSTRGVLRKSLDHGHTWENVPIYETSDKCAVPSQILNYGNSIFVLSGSDGLFNSDGRARLIFHFSPDNGVNWTRNEYAIRNGRYNTTNVDSCSVTLSGSVFCRLSMPYVPWEPTPVGYDTTNLIGIKQSVIFNGTSFDVVDETPLYKTTDLQSIHYSSYIDLDDIAQQFRVMQKYVMDPTGQFAIGESVVQSRSSEDEWIDLTRGENSRTQSTSFSLGVVDHLLFVYRHETILNSDRSIAKITKTAYRKNLDEDGGLVAVHTSTQNYDFGRSTVDDENISLGRIYHFNNKLVSFATALNSPMKLRYVLVSDDVGISWKKVLLSVNQQIGTYTRMEGEQFISDQIATSEFYFSGARSLGTNREGWVTERLKCSLIE